jgi:hypothetical protein
MYIPWAQREMEKRGGRVATKRMSASHREKENGGGVLESGRKIVIAFMRMHDREGQRIARSVQGEWADTCPLVNPLPEPCA